jgi:putative transposase
MTRPLRLQFAGAFYHITARGDRKAVIYQDDTDRAMWLQTLGDVCTQSNFTVYAFCQMNNHYHLLLESVDGNLSQGMRQLNGVYSQYFNRRHGLVGHVFQGRYHSILVQKESYLLELARYIVLNPVRAQMVSSPEGWAWSSYRLMTSSAQCPAWLDASWLLNKFHRDAPDAIAAFQEFVIAGIGIPSPLARVQNQLLLGDEDFAQRFQSSSYPACLTDVSRRQRGILAAPLPAYQEKYPDRNEAMAQAYATNAYTLAEIARHFDVSSATVSRALKARARHR